MRRRGLLVLESALKPKNEMQRMALLSSLYMHEWFWDTKNDQINWRDDESLYLIFNDI